MPNYKIELTPRSKITANKLNLTEDEYLRLSNHVGNIVLKCWANNRKVYIEDKDGKIKQLVR